MVKRKRESGAESEEEVPQDGDADAAIREAICSVGLCLRLMFAASWQVKCMNLPQGPSNIQELFRWPAWNAKVFLGCTDLFEQFVALMSGLDKIIVHENFAGTGNGSMSFYQQYTALKAEVMSGPKAPAQANWPQFVVATAYDVDPSSRSALDTHHEDRLGSNCSLATRFCFPVVDGLLAWPVASYSRNAVHNTLAAT